jgi:hypothetical protein
MEFTPDGAEILSQVPHALSLTLSPPTHITQRLREQVYQFAHSIAPGDEEFETFEEADDFDVGEEKPSLETEKSIWEDNYDLAEMRKIEREKKKQAEYNQQLKVKQAAEKEAQLAAAKKLLAETGEGAEKSSPPAAEKTSSQGELK